MAGYLDAKSIAVTAPTVVLLLSDRARHITGQVYTALAQAAAAGAKPNV